MTFSVKLFCVLFVSVSLLGICTSCSESNYQTRDFFAMDTYISVKAMGASQADLEEVERFVKATEKTFSRTDPESEIYRLNSVQSCEVSPSCAQLLMRAASAADATQGAFNPCLGLISDLWDVTGKKYLPSDAEIADALAHCSYNGYEVDDTSVLKKDIKTKIDLGAAVKGYTAGEALKILKERGVSDAMISLGGNIAVSGHAKGRTDGWGIGVRSPYFPDELALTFSCTDRVIAVSGDYERYFERDGVRYHHIFDSATGKPTKSGLRSTAVICADGFTADMLSTALFVMGAEKAGSFAKSSLYDFEAILFTDDGKVLYTDGLADKITLSNNAKAESGTPLTLLPLSEY